MNQQHLLSSSLTILFTFFLFFGLKAQKGGIPASELILKEKQANTSFSHHSPFEIEPATLEQKGIQDAVQSATFLKLNQLKRQNLLTENSGAVELSLPYNGMDIKLDIVEVQILTDDFTVVTSASNNQAVSYQSGKYYRGIVQGDENSLVSISVFENEIFGFISSIGLGNLVLGKLETEGNTEDYVIYNSADLTEDPQFECGTEMPLNYASKVAQYLSEGPGDTPEFMDCIRHYLEADYALYQDKGSVTATVNYITMIFNEVSTLFASESISVSISQIYVWVSPDSYPTSSLAALNSFQSLRTTFNGDLAHLISLNPSAGLSGIAYVDVICGGSPYGYSRILSSYSSVPTYSWTIEVLTHELGHNYGSPHTHACVWGTNNDEPIDCCGAYAGNPESSCGGVCNEPNPTSCTGTNTPAGCGGTIMSYCHLSQSGSPGPGINFTLGFGTEPGDLIRNRYNNATCLSACSSNGCPAPTALSVSNIGGTAADISWAAAAGAVSYNVRYKPTSSSTWTTVNTSNLTLSMTGLTSGGDHDVEVQTVCAGGTSDWSTGLVFTTVANCPPPASNTTSSSNPVCSGISFTLSTDVSYGPTYQYQWQSSSDNTTYNNIVGEESESLTTTQTGATWYQCIVSCGANSITSTPLQVTMDPVLTNCYCTPASTTCTGFNPNPDMQIERVVLENLDNINGTCSSSGYGDYSSGQTVPVLQKGGSHYITIYFGDYDQRQTVFIDFNQDGDFEDAGEEIQVPYSSNLIQGAAIYVPLSATTGQTRMRVRSRYWGDGVYPPNACDGGFFGETEDYTINISGTCASPCYQLPQATNCENPVIEISRIQLGTLDNIEGVTCGIGTGFQDYTGLGSAPVLSKGTTYPMTITSGNFSQRQMVYFDFNQDGDFMDAGEDFTVPFTGASTQTVDIAIPVNASVGQTRMRVRTRYWEDGYPPDPTSIYSTNPNDNWGESEDYIVQIASALPVELIDFSAIKNNESTTLLTWETASERGTDYFEIQRSTDGKDFFKINRLDAAGDSDIRVKYQEYDVSPFSGTNYYRLRIVDFDGSVSFSAIRSITFENKELTIIDIFPNPANEQVQLRFNLPSENQVFINIFDVSGKIVRRTNISASAGENLHLINLSDMGSGVYLLSIEDNAGIRKTKRFVKE